MKPELDLDLLDFTVRFHKFVANLQQHSKRKVGLLDRGQNFGLIDIATGQHRMDVAIGCQLHVVDLFHFADQHVSETVSSINGRTGICTGACGGQSMIRRINFSSTRDTTNRAQSLQRHRRADGGSE